MADFNKIGLLTLRDGSFLVCRKNNYTSKLIMPGGKIETGESAEECLKREIFEELGNAITLENIRYIGTYFDKAASDDPKIDKTVEIRLYHADLVGVPTPSSEIIELIWFNQNNDQEELSSIIKRKILPDLRARRLL